jgi:hypothetical protein
MPFVALTDRLATTSAPRDSAAFSHVLAHRRVVRGTERSHTPQHFGDADPQYSRFFGGPCFTGLPARRRVRRKNSSVWTLLCRCGSVIYSALGLGWRSKKRSHSKAPEVGAIFMRNDKQADGHSRFMGSPPIFNGCRE